MAYRVEQLAFTSSARLLRVAGLVTPALALMTLLTWHGLRGLTLATDALILGGLLTAAGWYRFQERYPPATLFAERLLDATNPFHGYVETDERTVRNRSVRLELLYKVGARDGSISLGRQKVSSEQIRKSEGEKVRIPFTFAPAGPFRRTIFLRVRTPTFPFGWGATFIVSQPE